MTPRGRRLAAASVLLGIAVTPAAADESRRGGELYQQKCAACHDQARERTPPRSALAAFAPDEVVRALTSGGMQAQGKSMSADDIGAVALFLTGKAPGTATLATLAGARCSERGGTIDLAAPQWNGWGRDLDNSRYQPQPGLTPEEVPKLKLKWAFGYAGTMTAGQPTIIGDRLYVTSLSGQAYALDARSGCIHWTVETGVELRSAITVGAAEGRFIAYFGDGKGVLHAVDAADGTPLWQVRPDEHKAARITAAPVLYRGRVYVGIASHEEALAADFRYPCCSFRGSVAALDAASGKRIWQTPMIAEPAKPYRKNEIDTQLYGPAGAAIWDAPTIDTKRGLVYVGTGNSYTGVDADGANAIVALDAESGAMKWVRQMTPHDNYIVGCGDAPGIGNCPNPAGPDVDFGSSPILRNLPGGKQVILAGQKSGMVYALDPDDGGKTLWKTRVGRGGALGGVEWGPAADEQNVYVAISDVSRDPGALPGLTALTITEGRRVWQAPSPKVGCSWGSERCGRAFSAAVTVIPGVVFAGSTDGHLRAYATADGAVLWDVDTARSYDTVNHVPASGGSLDTGGPTLAHGMLFVNSGYGRFWGHGGNVLLAFSVDGK